MTEKDDLRARLYELHVGTDEHHATARQIRVMIQDGDLAAAADALDALDADIHPALAAGGGGGGSGLPEQWTVGDSGDVVITSDDPLTLPLKVKAAPGGRAEAEEIFAVDDDDDNPKFGVDAVGGIGMHLVDTPVQGTVTIDEFEGEFGDIHHALMHIGGPFASGGAPLGVGIRRDGALSIVPGNTDVPAFLLSGVNAAPLASNLAAGEFSLWLDATNGAAKLMVIAKTFNGTVVTGQVALS